MNLTEYEGKQLFRRYGIAIPRSVFFRSRFPRGKISALRLPVLLKAQVHTGDRKRFGGMVKVSRLSGAGRAAQSLLRKTIHGEHVASLLAEEYLPHAEEYYVSFSYDTASRGPVLSLSCRGGTGIHRATVVPVDMIEGLPDFFLRSALAKAKFPQRDWKGMIEMMRNLWRLFLDEYCLLAEINPVLKTKEGALIAGDAKIILDDEKQKPAERRFLTLAGDIAILASGGGASLLNIDALLSAGGKPANYTEYSGNPPAEVVKELTKRVLGRKGLKGCWVVGGTANFTDIFETLRGFLEGLREITPRPLYPIVIRRDGPRQKEAFNLLHEAGAKEGYCFFLYGAETPMAETARIMVKEAYRKP